MAQAAIVLGPDSVRRPAGGAYKLLGATAAPISAITVMAANTNAAGGTVCQVGLAMIEPGYVYVEGDAPAAYQWLYQNVALEPGSPPISISIQMIPTGWRVVVWTDLVGANFFCSGLTES